MNATEKSEQEAAPEFSELYDEENGEGQSEFAKDYIPLTMFQHSLLTLGTGLAAFLDPTRAESIAVFGEVTAGPVLRSIRQKMLNDPEGSAILIEKPRINSKTINLEWLASLPPDTLGGQYIQFLRKNNVTPDSRLPVRFIADPELAYVMQRYREAHDLFHTITGMPTNMLGEVVVKWIEGIQLGLPMCLTGGLFGATRLRPKQRAKYVSTHLNWALQVGFTASPLINIYFERHWEEPIVDLRQSICPLLNSPP
ncbi:unnamed protein product [Allacma fusca]|uniref:Ubiquinone biosynthesis protein COQ4 homolog, mitochondrial n=1 Tax=Allacma fusca TaxID=39272 RepID=A0A8J2KFH2_9HEXA|nr:unnamed protein product [Allacma fusca]